MATRPKTLAGVRANEGLEALYRKRLTSLVDDLHASLSYWLTAAYRQKPPEISDPTLPARSPVLAQDLDVFIGMSPAMAMREVMRRLSKRWNRNFDKAAPKLAEWFAMAAQDRSDKQLAKILRDSGFSVRFRMTREQNDILQATIGEQVSLIKSIAQQHLSQVEILVLRSVAAGRDIGGLSKELKQRYQVTKRRADLIARTENNKATTNMTVARQLKLGITHGVWCHSAGGKEPRPTHVKAGADKVVFELAKGWFDPDEGEYVLPRQLINCKCFWKPVLPTE